MTFKAVLFDLDGTLLNTLQDIADCGNTVLAALGLPQHKLAAYRYFVGDGRDALVARILPENQRDAATVAKVAIAFDREYDLHWTDNTRPYVGVPALLQDLSERSLRMAVVSNKPDGITRLAVSRLLPRWQFEVVLGARPAVPKKPDPAAALEVARTMGLAPADFLYLGDSDIDMRTAQAAGMFPVGALWGFRSAAELRQGGAAALIAEPGELLKLL